MADNVKTLVSAAPIVDTQTGFVMFWYLELNMKTADGSFERNYPFNERILNPSKPPQQYTVDELISLYPKNIDDVFDHHAHVHSDEHEPPHEHVHDFDMSQLASGQPAKKTK